MCGFPHYSYIKCDWWLGFSDFILDYWGKLIANKGLLGVEGVPVVFAGEDCGDGVRGGVG